MKKVFGFFILVCLAALMPNCLFAQTQHPFCTYMSSGSQDSHIQYCKRQLATVYVSKTASFPIEVSFSAPSENVIAVAGPNTDSSFRKEGSTIYVKIGSRPIEEVSWMEVIVNGGYYHVKIVTN